MSNYQWKLAIINNCVLFLNTLSATIFALNKPGKPSVDDLPFSKNETRK